MLLCLLSRVSEGYGTNPLKVYFMSDTPLSAWCTRMLLVLKIWSLKNRRSWQISRRLHRMHGMFYIYILYSPIDITIFQYFQISQIFLSPTVNFFLHYRFIYWVRSLELWHDFSLILMVLLRALAWIFLFMTGLKTITTSSKFLRSISTLTSMK